MAVEWEIYQLWANGYCIIITERIYTLQIDQNIVHSMVYLASDWQKYCSSGKKVISAMQWVPVGAYYGWIFATGTYLFVGLGLSPWFQVHICLLT